MIAQHYLQSGPFSRSVADWATVLLLFVAFFGFLDPAEPYFRDFSILDKSLQHPFTVYERVTDNQLYAISVLVPLAAIVGVTLYKRSTSKLNNASTLHLLNVSVLGLFVSLSVNGCVTDILKNWIGRPRPDFLARCGAPLNTPLDTLQTVSICTAPLGKMYLTDGMKSTPSGHLSISASGLVYLQIWLVGQLLLAVSKKAHVLLWVAVSLPLLLAAYIALLRSQDYRHHFFDLVLGLSIGSAVAAVSYCRYFPLPKGDRPDLPRGDQEETLPR